MRNCGGNATRLWLSVTQQWPSAPATTVDERTAYQAATIDVLKAMSASPGDPQPVFDLIANRATRILRGGWGHGGAAGRRHVTPAHPYRCDPGRLGGVRGLLPLPRRRLDNVGPGRSHACARAQSGPSRRSRIPDEGDYVGQLGAVERGGTNPAGWRADRRYRDRLVVGGGFSDRATGVAENLRRAGGDRHHQRRDVSRAANPHSRSSGVAGIPDRDQRRAEGHQPLDLRSATGAGYGGRDRRAALRCRSGHDHPPRGRIRLRLAANFGFPPEYEAHFRAHGLDCSSTGHADVGQQSRK